MPDIVNCILFQVEYCLYSSKSFRTLFCKAAKLLGNNWIFSKLALELVLVVPEYPLPQLGPLPEAIHFRVFSYIAEYNSAFSILAVLD